MRQITVTAPQGKGPEIAEIAFSVGIRDVSVSSIRALKSNEPDRQKDHLEIETATHLAKAFVEKLSAFNQKPARDDLNSSLPSRAVQGEAIAALRQSR